MRMHMKHGWHSLKNMKCLKKGLNEVTKRWNTCKIKDTRQDPDIWFNKIYNLNPDFKKTKKKYEKYEYETKAHLFDVLRLQDVVIAKGPPDTSSLVEIMTSFMSGKIIPRKFKGTRKS